MSTSTKALITEPSQHGGVYFQAFSELLKQREALDHQILRLQGRFFKIMEKKSNISFPAKKYVARMQNNTILREAIREIMAPGHPMNMKEILCRLEQSGRYHTQSSYFYTMVNNKLNRDPKIKKESRGIFVLSAKNSQKTGKLKEMAS